MSLYSDILLEQLIEAWYKLQEAQLDFEQTPDETREYSRRYDALVLTLEEFDRVVEKLKPRGSIGASKEAGGS
jgi:hypothetical protein